MAIIALLRPKQWSKNLLVFAAFIFTGKFNDPDAVRLVLMAFAAMCLASSAIYVFNDLLDVKRDREHPTKKNRPIASGKVSPALAVGIGVVALGAGIALAGAINTTSVVIILSYLALQVAYNAFLKRTPIADVFCIATGFILRAVLGAAAISVLISGWLLFCTGALALMLGFAKRRNEFIVQGENRTNSRESLAGYSKSVLDALVIMSATGAAMCYGIYSIESPTAKKYSGLVLTSFFVFYGIARYVLLVFSKDEGGEPADVLFKDPHMLGSVLLFLVSAVFAITGGQIPLIER
ncbi:MAG: decaprenyl-phosphate phosphoribosyltransferase [Fimbriimonadaceae bacterium]|nr:decaprenyl-phosphate phosphoribosyltransferase [Fimbriimonadaceae bacterium]